MTTVFWGALALGGLIMLLQAVFGLVGAGADGFDMDVSVDVDVDVDVDVGDADTGDGLDLRSIRAVAAGLATFGLGGLAALAAGLVAVAAALIAVLAGLGGAAAMSWVMRSLRRLESDGTVDVRTAIGQPATVYLRIPGEGGGAGKVSLTLGGRIVEYQAVSRTALPTGAHAVVVDVVGPDTLEVAPTLDLGETIDAPS